MTPAKIENIHKAAHKVECLEDQKSRNAAIYDCRKEINK